MTTFLLIRHGETDAIGKSMMGWLPGWHLNQAGQRQVMKLGERLARLPIRALYTSPLERATETAEAVARSHGLEPQKVEDLGEIRMGEWEGLTMQELDGREDWKKFNTYRSGARCPGGETMAEVQVRMMRQLQCLETRHANQMVAVVSHGDPLRAAVSYYLGVPVDLMQRFEISPGSVTAVEAAEWGPRVLCVNETGDVPL
jgi:probable phosphomutase (TIGR03848 family)